MSDFNSDAFSDLPDMSVGSDLHGFLVLDGCRWHQAFEPASEQTNRVRAAAKLLIDSNPTSFASLLDGWATTDAEQLGASIVEEIGKIWIDVDLSWQTIRSGILGHSIAQVAQLALSESNFEYSGPPDWIVELMAGLMMPMPGERALDPACGTGRLLIGVANSVARFAGDNSASRLLLFGQDPNHDKIALARLFLYLCGFPYHKLSNSNALSEPAFAEGNQLSLFDVVICDSPLGNWFYQRDEWGSDPYLRGATGLPPTNRAEFAWVQHIVASLRPGTGRAAVILPVGALFRGGSEGNIRKSLIERDLLESVIWLGRGIRSTGVSQCIMVFRSTKAAERQGKVCLINAARLIDPKGKPLQEQPSIAAKVTGWISDFRTIPGHVRVVSLANIAAQNWGLNEGVLTKPEPGMLLRNAIVSIRLGLEDLEQGSEERILSSIRNLYAGILLLFKEKLRRLSPPKSDGILMWSDIEPVLEKKRVVFRPRGDRSAEVQQIRERFKRLGVTTDWQRIHEIQKKRNAIEHLYLTDKHEAIQNVVSNTFVLIVDFLERELQEDPRELLGTPHWNAMLRTSQLYEELKARSRTALKKLDWSSSEIGQEWTSVECSNCKSSLLEPSAHIATDIHDQYFVCAASGHLMTHHELESSFIDSDHEADSGNRG